MPVLPEKRFLISKTSLLMVTVCAMAAMCTPSALHAQSSLPREPSWRASWIGVADAPKINQWIAYRHTVTLPSTPKLAVARIAADSKYWLWINGTLVVFDGQLKRGPTPHDTYYDRVDLSGHLQKGKNTIAILLWHFGRHGFSHNSSGKAGLVFEANLDGKDLVSGTEWKAMLHPAFVQKGAPRDKGWLPENDVFFDARRDLNGWQQPSYDDSAWPKAVAFGVPPCAPWNKLVLRPIPLWQDRGLKPYENAASLPKVSNGGIIEAKLPHNLHMSAYMKIDAPAGMCIELRTDNYDGKNICLKTEYTTREGVQEFETPVWLNGHETHYVMPARIKILDLKYRETGYDTGFAGTFECDDAFLNRLHQKAVRTLYVTMRDTYMDCPDRERAQWWGDEVIELGEAFYALDAKGWLLARKGILELINWQRKDNTLFSPVPAGNWDQELPMQMLASVGYYGFWTYFKYSHDAETMKTVYPGVKRYMSVWQLGDDGLVVHRNGGWLWGDWGDDRKDWPLLFNTWVYLALKGQMEMAKQMGLKQDMTAIKTRMDSIEANFNKAFWKGHQYRSNGYRGPADDRGHALAVVAGLAGPDKYEAIRKVLQTQYLSSIYMEKYVLEALYIMHFEDDAGQRMKRRYEPMVAHSDTTLWEHWERGGARNHGWSGGPMTLMSQYILGVAPETMGYDTYHVLPQLGSLRTVKGNVPSVKGPIGVDIRDDPTTFSLSLASPARTKALVGIPKDRAEDFSSITVNAKTVWANGKADGQVQGLTFVENKPHYILFSVSPGKWTFEAKKKTGASIRGGRQETK